MKIELLILDIDGVLTDGTKVYDKEHNVVSKRFMCKDFTAIKRFLAAGIKVIFISGDSFNEQMARKRNIDFYCTRNSNLNLDKSTFLDYFENFYNIPIEKMAFVGDDYFDLSIIKKLKHTFCPSDSPEIIRNNCNTILISKGGGGVIVELYDMLVGILFDEPLEEIVNELDRNEITSKEMK